MKHKLFFILFISLLLSCKFCAADFKILVNFTEGEHSKDSWTKTTLITIDDNAYFYSISGSGHSNLKSDNKNGAFTDEQRDKIKTFVLDHNLNVNDSLFEEESKYKSYERFTNIAIDIWINNVSYRIRINGDITEFNDKPLYKNSMDLISLITDYIKPG